MPSTQRLARGRSSDAEGAFHSQEKIRCSLRTYQLVHRRAVDAQVVNADGLVE